MRLRLGFGILLLVFPSVAFGQTAMETDNPAGCTYWFSRVELSPKHNTSEVSSQVPPPAGVSGVGDAQHNDPDNVRALSESQAMTAIGCLLKLEDNRHPAKFWGATKMTVSQLFAPATVNLAALYYISYVFTRDFSHAGAVALRGPHCGASVNGAYATRQQCIHRAFTAYRGWFAQIKHVGLERARAEGLSPLAGSGIEWYGP